MNEGDKGGGIIGIVARLSSLACPLVSARSTRKQRLAGKLGLRGNYGVIFYERRFHGDRDNREIKFDLRATSGFLSFQKFDRTFRCTFEFQST